jgi:iron(III) transport system permease protein
VTRWRLGVACLLLALIALPVGVPIARLVATPDAWSTWREAPRLLGLVENTLKLVVAVVAVAVPLGVLVAVILVRTDVPFRGFFRFLLLLTLFVPLPLFTSGWQAAVGSGGWLAWPAWNRERAADPSFNTGGSTWAPWGQGIGSATLIHVAAGLPWVVLLVGEGLRRVERELEEDAMTAAPPWLVLWRVTLTRAGAALGAAALWVALQAATEFTVTDMMQVRTFAEEVYVQDAANVEVAPAVAVAMPSVGVLALLVLFVAGRWERSLPPRASATEPLVFHLGHWRWPAALAVGIVCGVLLAIPLGSLVWRAGLERGTWSLPAVGAHLRVVARAEMHLLIHSLLVACLAGGLCALLALIACWTCLDSRKMRFAILILLAVAWALPGPIVGLGLKGTLRRIVKTTDVTTVDVLLDRGPSPVPVLWADLIRMFPFAVALLWPVVRQTPPELRDAARVDGATPGQELAHVVWPLSATAAMRAALAAGVLSLGELSSSKLVSTPDWPSYAETIFVQMHYGVTADLAARCLWLLLAVTLGTIALAAMQGWFGRERNAAPLSPCTQGRGVG